MNLLIMITIFEHFYENDKGHDGHAFELKFRLQFVSHISITMYHTN